MRYSGLLEREIRGTSDFPIAYFRIDRHHLRYEMELHWHPELEILRVRSGSLSLHLNREIYQLGAGDIAVVNAGVLHRGLPSECEYECAVFHLDQLCSGGAASRYVAPLLDGGSRVTEVFTHKDAPDVECCVGRLFDALRESPPQFDLEVYASVYELILALYRGDHIKNAPRDTAQMRRLAQLRALLDWIDGHYSQRITLADLSRVSGMNEKYLCRFFREYTDCTPIEYVNRLRVEKTVEDMRLRRMSVTEAAFANGFNDSAYFSKVFRRLKGVSPREYRREI